MPKIMQLVRGRAEIEPASLAPESIFFTALCSLSAEETVAQRLMKLLTQGHTASK